MPDNSPQSILDIILTEVRSICADLNETSRSHGERLSSIEATLKSIIGNGTKGRLTLVEEAVQKLNQFKWYLLGAAASGGGILATAFHIVGTAK